MDSAIRLRLGYYDIGFQVRASGHPDMMRDGYSSFDNNLFVMDVATESGTNSADTIRAERFADLTDDRRLNFGDPARLPFHLDSSTRDAQP